MLHKSNAFSEDLRESHLDSSTRFAQEDSASSKADVPVRRVSGGNNVTVVLRFDHNETLISRQHSTYVHLQFIRIVSDILFLPRYEWLKKTDPNAGEHGYHSSHMAFFCYDGRKAACELRDDFLERGPLSAKYWALVDRMPRLGDVKLAGREHAELAPKTFFKSFLDTADNHFPHWTSKSMLHYMIGGMRPFHLQRLA